MLSHVMAYWVTAWIESRSVTIIEPNLPVKPVLEIELAKPSGNTVGILVVVTGEFL